MGAFPACLPGSRFRVLGRGGRYRRTIAVRIETLEEAGGMTLYRIFDGSDAESPQLRRERLSIAGTVFGDEVRTRLEEVTVQTGKHLLAG